MQFSITFHHLISVVQSSIHSKSAITKQTIIINTKCWGRIYEGGKKTTGFPFSDVEDVIICEADLPSGKLRWQKNGDTFKECDVPLQMNGKTVYLSIIMSNTGDEVLVSL